MSKRYVAGLGAATSFASLAYWLDDGRAALAIIGAAMSFLLPYAAVIQWRDFKSGVMRHGPDLRWQATRTDNPFRFWMVAIVGALCIPLGIAALVLLWWAVIWGNWE